MQPNHDQDAFLQQAEAAIEARFPLLKTVCLASGPGQVLVPAPFFVATIAAILESADKPCCVVLPDKTGVSLAVRALVALTRLRIEVPEILRSHAFLTFQQNDHVLVHPSGLVYEYQGFFHP